MSDRSLRPPTNLVSPVARWYWAIRALLGWALVFALETILWLATPESTVGHIVVLAITLGVATLHLIVMPQWRYRVHRWETTTTAVYTQSGWLTQERRIAPLARIQTVDTHRGPFEQLFGLADVTITTASAAGPLQIHGLGLATAEALVDELTRRAPGGDGT